MVGSKEYIAISHSLIMLFPQHISIISVTDGILRAL